MSTPTIDDETLAALCSQASGEGSLDRAALVAALSELQRRRESVALEQRLREGQERLMELTRAEALGGGDLEGALLQIAEAAAEVLDVGRASVWRYNDARDGLICVELYLASEQVHESGIELSAADFPAYFEAVAAQRVIAATDAHSDPHTAEFSEVYLTPLGIGAMLDVPVRVGDQVIGVLCCEHVGGAREWSAIETQLASSLADFTALAFETNQRRTTEQELRASVLLAEQRLAWAVSLLESRLGLTEIALRMGYSEHSAFTRAFKRWTGSCPTSYRRSQRLPHAPPRAPARSSSALKMAV